jgi:hypothetical protein
MSSRSPSAKVNKSAVVVQAGLGTLSVRRIGNPPATTLESSATPILAS